MVSPADLNEYMEGPVNEVELKFNESLRYRKVDPQEEVIDMQQVLKPQNETEFDLEEKRQIKKTIDEEVEHVNMLDDNEEGVNSFVESLLSKDSSEESKIIRIKLSDKDS